MLKVLSNIDPSKSANGVSPAFWKRTAAVVCDAVTSLFKFIVQKHTWPKIWKIARVTPPHKRGSVHDEANYRPLSVLPNLSVYFEGAVDDQFDAWNSKFVPESQFGFVKRTGTADYGAALACSILEHINSKDSKGRRGEGILISLDVKGAFDRVWWARLKARLKKRGMSGKALKLLYNYLSERFIQVVKSGDKSSLKEIFSGVPQGAKWSPKLWNLDISEMECWISDLGMLICYADDSGLWYPITEGVRDHIIDIINQDLQGLVQWAADNHTTFEPSKTHFTLISNRTSHRFDPTGIIFDGVLIERKSEVKLVGYTFDEHMTWSTMIDKLYRKARSRMGMLTRLRSSLDNNNMQTVYTSFIRPILEYGSVAWMGAADTHLKKLDSIQHTAMKIGCFKIESLDSRRKAAAAALVCKLLDGDGRGALKNHIPQVVHSERSMLKSRLSGIQLVNRVDHDSLSSVFDRSFIGAVHGIWSELPDEIKIIGDAYGWQKVEKTIKQIITGKIDWGTTDEESKIGIRIRNIKNIAAQIKMNKAHK